jgi:hypothetical protein
MRMRQLCKIRSRSGQTAQVRATFTVATLYLHVCPTFFQTFVCSLLRNDVFIAAKIKNVSDAVQLDSGFRHFQTKLFTTLHSVTTIHCVTTILSVTTIHYVTTLHSVTTILSVTTIHTAQQYTLSQQYSL